MPVRVRSGRRPNAKVEAPSSSAGLRLVTGRDYHAQVCASLNYQPLLPERCSCGLAELLLLAEREMAGRVA